MPSRDERRRRRWVLRRLARQERRRAMPSPAPVPRMLAAASLVDGYCDAPGPAANENGGKAAARRCGPPLALVRT